MEFTIVNYLPFQFIERKPSLVPEEYTIPAATDNEKTPGILHVSPVHSRLYMPLQEQLFKVPIDAESLARDLVKSLVSAQIEYEDGVAAPAIFYLPGTHSAREVKANFAKEVDAALARQNLWLLKLVKKADDEWQKFRQHKFITDMQRWAAKKLGMKKEWGEVSAAAPLEVENCKFCGHSTLKGIVVCPNCKNVLDSVRFKQLQATGVTV